jgi:hypothetical protein
MRMAPCSPSAPCHPQRSCDSPEMGQVCLFAGALRRAVIRLDGCHLLFRRPQRSWIGCTWDRVPVQARAPAARGRARCRGPRRSAPAPPARARARRGPSPAPCAPSQCLPPPHPCAPHTGRMHAVFKTGPLAGRKQAPCMDRQGCACCLGTDAGPTITVTPLDTFTELMMRMRMRR